MENSQIQQLNTFFKSIIIQHKEKKINTVQLLEIILPILQKYPEMNTNIDVFYIKKFGLTEAFPLFLEVLNFCECKLKFVCDKKVLCFFGKKVSEFCKKEFYEKDEFKRDRENNQIKNKYLLNNEETLQIIDCKINNEMESKNKKINDTNEFNNQPELINSEKIDIGELNSYYKNSSFSNGKSLCDSNQNHSESDEEIFKNKRLKMKKESEFIEENEEVNSQENDFNNFVENGNSIKENNELNEDLIDYIENDDVNAIINLFNNLFTLNNSTFLLQLIYDVGIFDLFNVLITENVCFLYDSIFKNKIFLYEKNEVENVLQVKFPIYEIKRKLFDGQVVFKEKKFVDNKILLDDILKVNDNIYKLIIDDFLEKNGCYFIMENGIKNLINVFNYYFSTISENNFDDTKNILYYVLTDLIIKEIQNAIIKEETQANLKFYASILKYSIQMENYKPIITKLVCNFEFNKKIFKLLEIKNKIILKETCLVIHKIFNTIYFFNKNVIDHIDTSGFFYILEKEKNISIIFDLLNYESEFNFCILDLIKIMYKNCRKENFYKLSNIILIRYVGYKYEKEFCDIFLYDFLMYLKKMNLIL
ncbi:hypothetical protein GVAV_000660 [Gurleya vavrai]